MSFKDESLLKKYLNPIFVETGTQRGDGVDLALKSGFKSVYSIEINENLYKGCLEKYKGEGRVRLFFGDSMDVLPSILETINEPVTFWLDAHVNGKGVKALGKKANPILQEIEIVMAYPYPKIIFIDDIRLFIKKRGVWGYIGLEDVINKINSYGNFDISYEEGYKRNDIMVVR